MKGREKFELITIECFVSIGQDIIAGNVNWNGWNFYCVFKAFE